jgi:hypothetical protein
MIPGSVRRRHPPSSENALMDAGFVGVFGEGLFCFEIQITLDPDAEGIAVYLWKLERGYGRNIGIPQIDAFNSRIKNIRFYAERG